MYEKDAIEFGSGIDPAPLGALQAAGPSPGSVCQGQPLQQGALSHLSNPPTISCFSNLSSVALNLY